MKLHQVRKHALALEAVTEEPHHTFSSFRVRGKIFVTIPPDGEYVHAFVSEDERDKALAMYPAFTERLLWGGKVVGLRVHLADAIPSAVKQLVNLAYAARLAKDAGHKAKKPTAGPALPRTPGRAAGALFVNRIRRENDV